LRNYTVDRLAGLCGLAASPYGNGLLGIVALGLFAFGLYSFLEAAYRRINT